VGYFDADFVAGLVLEDGSLAFLSSAFEAFFAAAALPSLESFDCSFATFDSAFTSFFLALVNFDSTFFFFIFPLRDFAVYDISTSKMLHFQSKLTFGLI